MAANDLYLYLLRLADDNLIVSQRLSELVAKMPDLEEDIAIANVALDHLGQARNLYTYAGEVEGEGRSEDDLAMLRDEREFFNSVLVEQPNGDFAYTTARQFYLDAYQVPLYEALTKSSDVNLAGIAGKAAKEARYHLQRSALWLVRLGDGTDESHRRIQSAVMAMWPYTGDLFATDGVEDRLLEAGIAPDMAPIRERFDATIAEVFDTATIVRPTDPYQRLGGRTGFHTEHLGHILPELQSLYRAHAGADW